MAGIRKARRDLLVKTAVKLFYKNGFHATGIDKILKESGVAKMTLYKNFGSKEGLVKVALEEKSNRVIKWMKNATSNTHNGPIFRVLEIFDLHEIWFQEPYFMGCIFTKATAEYPLINDPIHQVTISHYLKILDIFKSLSVEAGLYRSPIIAEQILILLQGSITTAFATGAPIAARRAKRAAEQLFI